MAGGNSPFSSTGSVSSLLKSGVTLQNKMQDYNDALEAYDWDLSAKTDEDYAAYKNYLQGNINKTTDPTKILDYTKTITNITRTNISTSIQRENIQMMAGNASLSDKYNLVSSQYVRAYNNGDYSLAQNLESQAYSISQQIQVQQQQAAEAAHTLAKAGASSTVSGYEGVASSLNTALKQFNKDFAAVGQKGQTKAIKDFVNSPVVKQQMAALGIELPAGAAPNYFDIVEGVSHAIYQAHSLAATAEEPFDADKAQTYADKANAIVTGDTKFGVLGGSSTLQELQSSAAALANGQLAYNATTGGFGKADIPGVPKGSTATGFNFVPGQGAQTTLSPNAFVSAIPGSSVGELQSLGLQTNPGSKSVLQGAQVQVTDKSPQFLQQAAKNGTLLNVFTQDNHTTGRTNLVFKADAQQGPGSSVYYVVKDQNGKQGLYEEGQNGSRLVSSDGGFDAYGANAVAHQNNEPHKGVVGRALAGITNAASTGLGYGLSVFGNHASAQGLMDSATSRANYLAAQAMLKQPPPTLPNISLAPAPALPQIRTAPAPPPRSIAINPFPNQPVAPKTTNPQSGNIGVQGTGGVSLQGSGFRLQ